MCHLRSWQNSLVFLGVKHDTSCVYESSDCTETRVKELLRTVLNIRRDIQFLRVLRVYNGPDVRSGSRPIIACFSVSRFSHTQSHPEISEFLRNCPHTGFPADRFVSLHLPVSCDVTVHS